VTTWKSPQCEHVSDEYSIIVTGAVGLPNVFSESIVESGGSGVVGVGVETVVEEGAAGEDDESPPHDAHPSATTSITHAGRDFT
jgi:5,10-methylene-tetrahydrofolate dehydrogenase/methenyl tetrahydrofolate cyclohydrolase